MDFKDWLSDRLDKIENKVDKVEVHCNKIDLTMIRNTADLEYHIKRTDMLESKLKNFTLAKVLGVVTAILGIVYTLQRMDVF